MLRPQRMYDHADTPNAGGRLPPREADPAQESLSQALRAGFNVLRVIIVVLLIAYFLSGLFQVNPGEQGLIARFGKLRTTDEGKSYVFREGWHVSLPDPFDEKIRISGQNYKLRLDTFSFPLEEREQKKELSDIDLSAVVPSREKLKPGVDWAMISGDRNLSHGLWAVEYRIEDAAQFVQNVGETPAAFEKLLRRLAENAIVRTVAGLSVERVTRIQTEETVRDFTELVKERLAQELAQLRTGVTVVNVEAKTVQPGMVRQAFLRVSDAKSQRKEKEDQARQEAHRILSKTAGPRTKYEKLLEAIEAYGVAQAGSADEAGLEGLRQAIDGKLDKAEGEVAVRLRQAQSRANEIRERVQQEYRLFVDYRDTYRKYPVLTVVRLWVRMRDAVLNSAENEIFFLPEAGEIEIITNRDVQRRIEAEIQRYKQRYKTEE